MNVLFLTDGIHPFQLGGMQKHSLILSKLLCKNQIKVCLVHCGGEGYSKEHFDAQFEGFDDLIDEVKIDFPTGGKLPGHYIRENKAYSKEIFESIDDLERFDLIYAQGFTGWEFIKRRLNDKSIPPVLLNFHGFEMYQKPPNLRVRAEYLLFKKAVKWSVLNADYVYSFGGQIDKILIELGVSSQKILSQSNGIEASWMVKAPSTNASSFKFVFVGRNERRKGIEELNASLLNMISDKDLDFEFHFVGPIPENSQLKDSRLTYHGEIREQNRIKEILTSSDCLVCPSHSEGMPTVILEAMSRGLAIIGTQVGAVERQIRGNGILIEELTIATLEDALIRMLQSDESQLLSFKKRSLELIEEKFLWEVIANQKIEDFKKIIEVN